MHSGGSSSSKYPTHPALEFAIGIAAIVLEGRNNESTLKSDQVSSYSSGFLVTSKLNTVSGSSSQCTTSTSSIRAVRSQDLPPSTATAAITTTTTATEWMRDPNNSLQSIFRLKNRLVLQNKTGQEVDGFDGVVQQQASSRTADDDEGGFLMFESLKYMAAKTCLKTTPRSLLSTQTSRRNSRVSITTSIHCDEFLRKIGLSKIGKLPTDNETDEEHHCSAASSENCFRWQNFFVKLESTLNRERGVCIEVFIGPQSHPILLEQWTIQLIEKPSQPSMTIQYLCSAIRSQIHFSQISAWSELLKQQSSSQKPNMDVMDNPRVITNRATMTSKLDLIYRINSLDLKHAFDRPPNVHQFPNVVIGEGIGLLVGLKSLPRLNRIPSLELEDVISVKTEVLSHSNLCTEKGKHRCMAMDDISQKRDLVECETLQVPSVQPPVQQQSSIPVGISASHREKQLMKYKKRLMKRDKNKQKSSLSPCTQNSQPGFSYTNNHNNNHEDYESRSINDFRLPLYSEVNEISGNSSSQRARKLSSQHTQTPIHDDSMQTVGTQTDFHMSIDDELHELGLHDDVSMEDDCQKQNYQDSNQHEVYLCTWCNNQMDFICWNCCDNKKFKKMKQKHKHLSAIRQNCHVRKFYKIPSGVRINCSSKTCSNSENHSGRLLQEQKKSKDKLLKTNNNNSNVQNKNLLEDFNMKEAVVDLTVVNGSSNSRLNNNYNKNLICEKSICDDNKSESSSKSQEESNCRFCKRQKTNNVNDIVAVNESIKQKDLSNKANESYSTISSLQDQARGSALREEIGYKTPKYSNCLLKVQSEENGDNNLKLSKMDHPTTSLSNSSAHCIKNLTNIFTNDVELQKPATPIVLKKLHLLPSVIGNFFNFDSSKSPDSNENVSGDEVFTKGVKKSLSTPSAFPSNVCPSPSPSNSGNNSLSPRFLKSASTYKKRRSRHLSDRSERSSICSEDLSLSDDECIQFTPNGSSLLLASPMSPVQQQRRIGGSGFKQPVWKNSFGNRPLLGSLEENLLQKRITPKFAVSGFKVLLGASGSFCPKQLTIPTRTFFYELSNYSHSTPYLCELKLPRKGYTIPRQGTVQVTLLNTIGTFVHMFVVPYDFSDMPVMSSTFIRQRSLMFDDSSATDSKPVSQLTTQEQMKYLRYVIHLRFQTTRSGRLVLHSEIKMLISRRTDHDTAVAHAKGGPEFPNELKTITITPGNPKFSLRLDKN